MIPAIVIFFSIALAAWITLRPKTNENSGAPLQNGDIKQTVLSKEEAIQIVQQLGELGYFKYAAQTDKEALKNHLTEKLAERYLSTIEQEKTGLPLDYRCHLFSIIYPLPSLLHSSFTVLHIPSGFAFCNAGGNNSSGQF